MRVTPLAMVRASEIRHKLANSKAVCLTFLRSCSLRLAGPGLLRHRDFN